MNQRARIPATLLACLLPFSLCAAEPPDPLAAGWEELTLLNPNPALDHFQVAVAKNPDSRPARLGEALALLNAQPRSEAHLTAAHRLFETLRDENATDDTGIAATYYLARIRQIHGYTTDRTAAVLAYRALLQAHPGNPVAELAAPKLAVLLLYDEVPRPVWEQRAREIFALLPALRSPEARRDTRLILADALIKLQRDHARALPLITYCLEQNLIVRIPRLNTLLLQAAESARLLGRNDEAAAYYHRFLESAPYDVKSPAVRQRLAQWEGAATP